MSDFIAPEAKQTDRPGLLHGVGGFGGAFDLTQLDYKEPVLISGTDGVGTKLLVYFFIFLFSIMENFMNE